MFRAYVLIIQPLCFLASISQDSFRFFAQRQVDTERSTLLALWQVFFYFFPDVIATDRKLESGKDTLVLTQKPQQEVLRANSVSFVLDRVVAGEEDRTPSFFGVTLEHLFYFRVLLRHLAVCPLPVQIPRHTDEDDSEARNRLRRTRDDRIQSPGGANQHVNSRQPWITRAAVGTWHVGTLPSQNEQPNHSQRVRQNHAEDHIGVELIVATTQGQQRRPDSLPDQAECR